MTNSTDTSTNNHSPQQTKPAQKVLSLNYTSLQVIAGTNTNNYLPQQIKPVQKVLPPSHTLLQITAGNAYDSRRQNLRNSTNININNHTP